MVLEIGRFLGAPSRAEMAREQERKIAEGAKDRYKIGLNPLRRNQDAINRGGIRKSIFEEQYRGRKNAREQIRKRWNEKSPAKDVEQQLQKQRQQLWKDKGVDKYAEGTSMRARKEREVEEGLKYWRRQSERRELRIEEARIKKESRLKLAAEYKNLNDQYRDYRQSR